jgi:SWI/SNF chromatin-remodeling complex subunit SWI1
MLDELVDVLEDAAFGEEGEAPPTPEELKNPGVKIWSQREIVDYVEDQQSQPFAALERRQGGKPLELGPKQRPGDIVLMIVNLIHNFSLAQDNVHLFAQHPRLIDVLLRVTAMAPGDVPQAASTVLSLTDLVTARKDALDTLAVLYQAAYLSKTQPATPHEQRTARRAFALFASFLIDPEEAMPPTQYLHRAGNPTRPPPTLADVALEGFTRLSLLDANRQVLAISVPEDWQWSFFTSLVHRLPITEQDNLVLRQSVWLTYTERVLMGLYSLAFLAPPSLKRRAQRDRALGLPKILFRIVRRFTADLENTHSAGQVREYFSVATRRAVELLKIVDDAADSFDVRPDGPGPALIFGMGYGEGGEGHVQKGNGILCGYQEDVIQRILMSRGIDEGLFDELESLARLE